jgi:kinesin family member 11
MSDLKTVTEGTNVQVAVRCRPANVEEKKSGQINCVATETVDKKVNVAYGQNGKKTTKTFNFDKVFGCYSTQEEVFRQMVFPLVQETVAGFNCTVFAYGQTGTGKTHTMEGDIHSEENAGIVPRAVKSIFEQLDAAKVEFTIRVSFLELYNEELQDLLTPPNSEKKLKLCEVEKKGVVCQNLEEITVLSVKDIFDILQRGILQRQTAATLCNKNSSRSHSIFTMKIMIKECNVDGEEVVRHGQLNLVDLAGSECVGRSGAKNDRAREAGSINQSLLTLGRVITALVDHHGHVPYRDSKLTRLLQESLGGKAKTCIIATLSPAQNAVEETLSTLDYAHRAKNIKNTPQVNQKMTKKTVMKEYCEEIESLRLQLQANREKNGIFVQPDIYYGMETRIASQEAQINEVESVLKTKMEETKAAVAEKDFIEEKLINIKKDLEITQTNLKQTTTNLEVTKNDLKNTVNELNASNAIIHEQTITETTLLNTGNVIQNELCNQRDDRIILVNKVNKLNNNDIKLQTNCNQYVTNIILKTTNLNNNIKSILNNNTIESNNLCNGVNNMLNKSKDTCNDMKLCIDNTVKTLIYKSENDKSINNTLSNLNETMSLTNDELKNNLIHIQNNITTFLNVMEDTILNTNKILLLQSKQTNELQNLLIKSTNDISEHATNFEKQQILMTNENIQLTKTLEVDVTSAINKQHELLEANVNQVNNSINAKAEEMQKIMNSMFKDMVSSTMSTMTTMTTTSKENTDTTTNIVQKSIHTINEANEKTLNNVNDVVKNIVSTVSASTNNISTNMSDIETNITNMANNDMNNMKATIIAKRNNLCETITDILNKNKISQENCYDTIEKANTSVNVLLKDIHNEAEEMNQSSAKSIDDFTIFMNGQGKHVCSGVSKHFDNLTINLNNTSNNIMKIADDSNNFRSSMAECVVPITGKTPSKQILSDNNTILEKLNPTRDHDVIRHEHKAGLWKKDVENNTENNTNSNETMEIMSEVVTTDSTLTIDDVVASTEINIALSNVEEVEVVAQTSPVPAVAPVIAMKTIEEVASIANSENVENTTPVSPKKTTVSRSRSSSGLVPKGSVTGMVRPRATSRTTNA